MMRFFKALGAGTLSGMGLLAALLIIFQIRPDTPAGWIALIGVTLGAFAAALIAFRWMMGAEFYPRHPEGGHGDSYMTGMGFGKGGARKRSEDDNFDV